MMTILIFGLTSLICGKSTANKQSGTKLIDYTCKYATSNYFFKSKVIFATTVYQNTIFYEEWHESCHLKLSPASQKATS